MHFKVVRERLLAMLGGKCIECGYSDYRALQVDHINGGGTAERKSKRGTSYYYHIIKRINSVDYQVLCANCNVIKRSVKQECPLKGCVKG